MSLLKTPSIHNVVVCDAGADELVLHWCIENQWITHHHKGRAQNVLSFLMEDAHLHTIKMRDINELGVVMGGPSFTATRVMTVIANTWGFVEHKQIRALPADFSSYDNEKKSRMWSEAQARTNVLPVYSAPPNITLKT